MNFPRPSELHKLPAVEFQSAVPTWKRALDIACILLALPLLLPVGFFIALLIKIVSPGPVLFRQERVGFRGRRFMCLKFRTMKVNADTGLHQGHLVRLMSSDSPMVKLDELPQLINVLRGEMSLVGPRPCIPYEYEHYLPRYRQRCNTLPGLTGLWQVNGKNRTTFEQMMELDLNYVKGKSLLLDVKILAMTVPAIVIQVCDLKARRQRRQTPAAQAAPVRDTGRGGL
jgi:lipopolysaccharide/colanic/teichoic acid biosynthesis glycosyltransferase